MSARGWAAFAGRMPPGLMRLVAGRARRRGGVEAPPPEPLVVHPR